MGLTDEKQWEKERRSVLGTKACGSTQEAATLPLHWKSGWSPATLKAFLLEAIHHIEPGKVPCLQKSVPGKIAWEKFKPGTLTDSKYGLTLEKLEVGSKGHPECVINQENIIAYKCYIYVRIWMAQRAQLWHVDHEELFQTRFTETSLDLVRHSRTIPELRAAIEAMVEEPLSSPHIVIARSPLYLDLDLRQKRNPLTPPLNLTDFGSSLRDEPLIDGLTYENDRLHYPVLDAATRARRKSF